LQRALCIKESELGCNHPVVAADIYNVALVCQALGNYSEAFALLRRALLIEQANLGLDHYTVQETQNALAELLEEIDEFAYLESPFTAEFIVKGLAV
jgi:tetratricopeptide (TPR) repeat protein